jgi:drug/metabolite transporter (DMT)-like permease
MSTGEAREAVPPASDLRRPLSGRAAGFALFLAALWGGNPVAIKSGLDDAPPLRLGWMRFVLGTVFVLIWALLTRQSFRVRRHEWLPLLGLGILFTTQLAFMNVGQDRTTAGHAVIITSTFPLWTGVFAHFLVPGDRLSMGRVLGTLVAYGGVVVVFSGSLDGESGLFGDFLLVVSAMLLGARQVFLSQTSQGIAIHKLLLAQSLVGVATFIVASALTESAPYVWTWELALALLYQGIVIAGFGFLGNTWLLQRFLPSRVAAMQLSTPVFGVLLSGLILDEPLGLELVVGLALVVAGSVLTQREARLLAGVGSRSRQ